MTEVTDSLALLSLEDDLTCSICLCPFDEPVSLNCGHSFCRACLEETWSSATSFYCPHCRAHYLSKPNLKKNTVLSAVVDTFRAKAGTITGLGSEGETDPGFGAVRMPRHEPKPIMCDMCNEAKAVKTCLTCTTSFCAEHVRPHQENPLFRAHELCEPLSDLFERLCPEHGKLMEFFCARHERSICSSCLQHNHKECGFSTPTEQRAKIESKLRENLNFLDQKTEKNQLVITQMREQQAKLKELAVVRKRALEAEYLQIREMLHRDEREAMNAVDKELESGNSKLNTLMKKFLQNVEKMSSTKAEINNLLAKSQTLDFLQASVDMPSVANFDPYAPRINLDSKQVIAHHSSIVNLKQQINKILREPVENRIIFLKPDLGNPVPDQGETSRKSDKPGVGGGPVYVPNPSETGSIQGEALGMPTFGSQHKGGPGGARKKSQTRDKKENRDQKERKDQKARRPERGRKGPSKGMVSEFSKSMEHLDNLAERPSDPFNMMPAAIRPAVRSELLNYPFNMMPVAIRPAVRAPVDMTPAVIGPATRNELLKYATMLTFDIRTAHKRVALSENNTKASVSDDSSSYPDVPARFTVCSQVLCTQGFSQGRHYWELKMSSNNFCGLGLAYASIDRKGPASRLGRNAQSWCIEWFNVKLSAWHKSTENMLTNSNPSRVGVLLDCDSSTATFYNVQDRAYPIHTFVLPFSEPVFPAFWIFSSGSSITLCKMSN